jgi:hypothetical protein
MNEPFDIRGNRVKNIGSNVNQRDTGFSLKDDSISTRRPRSHVAFQTLRNAGICVQLVLALVKDTKRPSVKPVAV